MRRAESAQPVVTVGTLPLFFASGVFVPWVLIPPWLRNMAVVAPVRHLSKALLLPFTHPAGSAVALGDLGLVALWGAAGLAVAARRFRWGPHEQG